MKNICILLAYYDHNDSSNIFTSLSCNIWYVWVSLLLDFFSGHLSCHPTAHAQPNPNPFLLPYSVWCEFEIITLGKKNYCCCLIILLLVFPIIMLIYYSIQALFVCDCVLCNCSLCLGIDFVLILLVLLCYYFSKWNIISLFEI